MSNDLIFALQTFGFGVIRRKRISAHLASDNRKKATLALSTSADDFSKSIVYSDSLNLLKVFQRHFQMTRTLCFVKIDVLSFHKHNVHVILHM